MKTALESYGYAPENIRQTLAEIKKWIGSLPEAPASVHERRLWSCHAVCRAAMHKWKLRTQGWKLRDGHFNGSHQHSWLERDLDEPRESLVLDIYPVASLGGPLLVHVSLLTPWYKLYAAAPDFYVDKIARIECETKLLLAA